MPTYNLCLGMTALILQPDDIWLIFHLFFSFWKNTQTEKFFRSFQPLKGRRVFFRLLHSRCVTGFPALLFSAIILKFAWGFMGQCDSKAATQPLCAILSVFVTVTMARGKFFGIFLIWFCNRVSTASFCSQKSCVWVLQKWCYWWRLWHQ